VIYFCGKWTVKTHKSYKTSGSDGIYSLLRKRLKTLLRLLTKVFRISSPKIPQIWVTQKLFSFSSLAETVIFWLKFLDLLALCPSYYKLWRNWLIGYYYYWWIGKPSPCLSNYFLLSMLTKRAGKHVQHCSTSLGERNWRCSWK